MQLNESENITITDCTNINPSEVIELYSRMEFYDILKDTIQVMKEEVEKLPSGSIHSCTWINTRIPSYCTGKKHDILNTICGDIKRECPQPCS